MLTHAASYLYVRPWLLFCSLPLIFSQYRLYVASLFFAAQLHKAAGLNQHFWYEMVERMVIASKGNRETAIKHYLEHQHSTYRWYRFVLLGGSTVVAVAGLCLVAYGAMK
jgi:hypothetical protein